MKLLLTSGGLANGSIVSSLKRLVQKPFNQLKLGFIPTASNLENGDKWWLIEDLVTCKRLGFKSIDLVDISALPEVVYKKRLEETDVLLFEGGNTYHLRYWVRNSGLESFLPELLKTRVYVGISAGSIIVTPSLILSSSEKNDVEKIGETVVNEGLGIVDFLVEPHINSEYFPELTFDYVREESKRTKFPVYALDDNSAIEVDSKKLTVISEGKWKIFN